jgi:serine/threonine-protein kinase
MAGGSSGQGGWAVAGLGPGSLIAGYRVEARIGAGGMAMVLRARDEALGRTVALKILAPALADDEEFRERFIRESRAAARVDHPHIIPVHAAGETDGVLYLAMRFVPGGDLRSVIRREGTLPGERAAFLLSPIASALDAAHAAGLVHRDVKPANILIDTSPGRPDHPYLSDFGLAKGAASTTGLTETGQFLGTPDYAAPEQISGRPVGPQTDQYALACVAYTMFTGSLPFARGASMAVLWAHMYDPPPSVSTRRRDLPLALDGVLDRALAKVPAERFGSCGEFTDALRAALGLTPYAGSRSGGASTGSTTANESSPLAKPTGSSAPPPTPTETVTPHPSFPPTTGTAPPQWHLPSMPSPLTVAPFAGPRFPESPPASSGAAHRDLAASRASADRDRRRRRLLVRGGLAGGVAVAAAAIAVLVSFIGNSPTAPGTSQGPTTHPPATHAPATRSPASGPSSPKSPSAAPSATAPRGVGRLTDSQSGLSYNQLPAPWGATASCPSTLNNAAFPWTDGEYAPAGQVNGNGGPATWYGEACSGPLPQQYGYSATSDLQTTAENLAMTFENAYYGALDHSITPGQDMPVQFSGHAAWEVTYDVTYTNASAQGVAWTDERAAVVVIDNGTNEPAVFFTSVPHSLNESHIPALVSSLRLSS